MRTTTEREPIANIEVEQALLGAVLVNNQAFLTTGGLRAEHFFEPLHQEIWRLGFEMFTAGNKVNPITLKPFFPPDQKVGPLTCTQYIVRLAADATTIVNAPYYAASIIDLWKRRKLEAVAEGIIVSAHHIDTDKGVGKLIEQKVSEILAIDDKAAMAGEISMRAAAMLALDHTAAAFEKGEVDGFRTKYRFMDALTGPLARGHYVQIGADTKVGKSALAMQIALEIAKEAPVLYFSLEMSADLIARRRLAAITGVGTMRQRRAKITPQEFEKMREAADSFETNFHVVCRKMTPQQYFDYARMFKLRHGDIGCVVLDHMGLVQPAKSGTADWEAQVQMSKIMKDIARELDCVTIGLSQVVKAQFMKGSERIAEKIRFALRKPTWRDMKGGIAADADFVLMPYRPAAVLDQVEPPEDTDDHIKWKEVYDRKQHVCEIHLVLARESDFPKIETVVWDGPRTTFNDLSIDDDAPAFGMM